MPWQLWEEGWQTFLLVPHTSDTQVGQKDITFAVCSVNIIYFRGDWDFCSPFPRDQCQWSEWGSWGRCSTSCGPGSRTRRRRIEGLKGRVGDCSGETEVAFQACQNSECLGKLWLGCSKRCSVLKSRQWKVRLLPCLPSFLVINVHSLVTCALPPATVFCTDFIRTAGWRASWQDIKLIYGHIRSNGANRQAGCGNIQLMIFPLKCRLRNPSWSFKRLILSLPEILILS